MTATTARPDVETAAQAPGGDRFLAVAMWVVSGLLLALQVLALEVIPPLLALGVLYIALGVVVARRHARWPHVTAIVLALIHLVGSAPFMAANLAHPESPGSFVMEALIAVAILVVLVGAAGGLRGARPRSRRPLALGAAAVAAVAVVVSLVAAGGVETDRRQPGDVVIESVRSQFPERVEIPAGGAGVWIDNQDPIHHTLVIEGTNVRAVIPASSAVRSDVALEPGTYQFFCDVPGHEGMQGELVAR